MKKIVDHVFIAEQDKHMLSIKVREYLEKGYQLDGTLQITNQVGYIRYVQPVILYEE